MKTVKVVAAVIKAVNKNGEDIIFATQRGYGEFKDGWEFPGGKIEEGETPQEALKREIMEELDTEITVGELIDTIEYDYPTFHLSMDCFWCEVVKGELVLKEAEAANLSGSPQAVFSASSRVGRSRSESGQERLCTAQARPTTAGYCGQTDRAFRTPSWIRSS